MSKSRRPLKDPYRPERDPSALHSALVGLPGLLAAMGLSLLVVVTVAVLTLWSNRHCWAFDRVFSEAWTGVSGVSSRNRPLTWYTVIFWCHLLALAGWTAAYEDWLWSSWRAQHVWMALTAIMLGVHGFVAISLLWS